LQAISRNNNPLVLTMQVNLTYSTMHEQDLNEVMAIEKRVFRHPWSYDFFRLIISDKNNFIITLKQEQKIIGYGGYHFLKTHRNFLHIPKKYRKLVHLINIAITPEYHRRGFGSFLLETLLKSASKQGAEYCYLEVRPSNTRAIKFYRKEGFSIIGIIKNYYPFDSENGLVMGKELKPGNPLIN